MNKPLIYCYSVLCLGLLGAFVLDISLGAAALSPLQIIDYCCRKTISEQEYVLQIIVLEVRLPRVLLALVVGAGLGMAGAALQGLLRNPLAGPGVLGISNTAALGAVIALYFGFSTTTWYALPIAGLLGAIVATSLLFLFAGRQSSAITLLLIGVALNAIIAALIALLINFAPNPYALQEIIYWLMGSVANRSFNDFFISAPFIALGILLLFWGRGYLDALSLGEETAKTLGFSHPKHQLLIVVGVALTVGAAVSVSGNIAFVGLIVPHILRPFVAHQPSTLLVASALGGAILLLLSDALVQALSSGPELKLSVVTSLLGGPFFLWMVYHLRHRIS